MTMKQPAKAAIPVRRSGIVRESLRNARGLLAVLADGKPHSGAHLARSMGMTRAAVWKQIKALRQRGLPVAAVTGSGYRVPWPLELLDAARICEAMPEDVVGQLGLFEVLWEVDSTSDELLRRQASGLADLSVLLAEGQSAGRGRRGRHWLSPPGLNLYLSIYRQLKTGVSGMSGLSLAVGVMLIRALASAGIHVAGLKWPNDVLAGDAKLAGILLDIDGEYAGPCSVIVGIGINLILPPAMRAAAGQAVTDLAELNAGQPPARNLLAAQVITQLVRGLAQFEQAGFGAFSGEFGRHDVLLGRPIDVSGAHGTLSGRGAGVDARGALLLETGDGCEVIDSGQVSIRPSS